MMTAITPELVRRIRDSLKKDSDSEGFYPLEEMSGHFVSLKEMPNTESMKQMFPVEVDGKQTFVYLKVV